LNNTSKTSSLAIDAAVHIEVRCRREDLVIEDLELKEDNIWKKIKRRATSKNNIVAAEQQIKELILREGLDVGNIHGKYGALTLARATAYTNRSD
jgi:hypothetical protein